MIKPLLRRFGWVKDADRRVELGEQRLKISERKRELLKSISEGQVKLIETFMQSAQKDMEMTAALLASLNHHAMLGEEWSKNYESHLDKLPAAYREEVKKFNDRIMAEACEKGVEFNHDPNPVFDFPLTYEKNDATTDPV